LQEFENDRDAIVATQKSKLERLEEIESQIEISQPRLTTQLKTKILPTTKIPFAL